MYELQCPSCNKPSHYNFVDFLLICPFCSTTFRFYTENGQKEIFGDHYIIPNTIDPVTVKELALEWLRRTHHKPNAVEREFFVTDVKGFSIPVWIVSLEAHTAWKGLVRKNNRHIVSNSGSDMLMESGQFRRTYRWAISARSNICETWGLTRLHEPAEPVAVEWDGFPFDSTLTRGRITEDEQKTAYESRHYFEYKYANGLPILGIQVDDEEGLRRARTHVDLYHYKLACVNCDFLIDHRTEIEVAGIQLVHIPVWKVSYVYRSSGILRHFFKPKEKNVLLEGHGKGILAGELALVYHDKVMINAVVTGVASIVLFLFGLVWHPAFLIVSIFAMAISGVSFMTSIRKRGEREEDELRKLSASIGRATGNPINTRSSARAS